MNLFLCTKGLSRGREEDHLTAFFAGALVLDDEFRHAYEQFVLVPYGQSHGWLDCKIATVDIQVTLAGYGCPDMVLTLGSGQRVACEHKLEAVETVAPLEEQENDPIPQLQRYLAAPGLDALMFVRATLKPPDPMVLEHPRYIRPEARQHFLWRDFFGLLEQRTHPYTRWLREGFETLGFTPPHPFIGDLTIPDNKQNLAKLWARTRARAHELGWSVGAGDVVELYLRHMAPRLVRQVWICPRNEQLLVRATPTTESDAPAIVDRFNSVGRQLDVGVNVERHSVRRTARRQLVVDAWTPLRAVLTDAVTGEEAENRLFHFVAPFIEIVS
jgi:hypothetical protein